MNTYKKFNSSIVTFSNSGPNTSLQFKIMWQCLQVFSVRISKNLGAQKSSGPKTTAIMQNLKFVSVRKVGVFIWQRWQIRTYRSMLMVIVQQTVVMYMCSNFLQLAPVSRDLYLAWKQGCRLLNLVQTHICKNLLQGKNTQNFFLDLHYSPDFIQISSR